MVRIYLNDYLVIQDTHSFCDEVVMRSKSSIAASGVHTVSNRHFLSKNSTLISRENCLFFLGEKLVKMLWFWTCLLLTTLISREKLSKKNLGEKLVKMLGFCQN